MEQLALRWKDQLAAWRYEYVRDGEIPAGLEQYLDELAAETGADRELCFDRERYEEQWLDRNGFFTTEAV